MKRHLIVLMSVAALGLSACATGPSYTPYQAAVPGKFGFSEERIEAARYRIVFEGNSQTTRQRVEDSLLLRAASVTLENGFDWFEIVHRATDPKTYQQRSPSMSSSWGGGFGYNSGFASFRSWSPRFGWVYNYQPHFSHGFGSRFYDYGDTREITRFQATAEIVFGRGAKPTNRADVFDARDVTANLTPRLIAPQPTN
jgi:hypothetical protein